MTVQALDGAVFRIPYDGSPEALPSRESVGSKAHNLMRMARIGLPVPAGFVLGTEVCRAYLARGPAALDGLERTLERELSALGAATGCLFGDPRRPLLVSVRSGAAVSMPGMMETVLDIGVNARTLGGLVRMTGNPRLARDCYRRLIEQFGEVVHAVAPAVFEDCCRTTLAERGCASLEEADTAGLHEVVKAYLDRFQIETGAPFPEDPLAQLRQAVEAVLRSWTSARAVSYRRLNAIPDEIGTAVTVQAMVFGNAGPRSGAGVGFTRSPADGENQMYVDYVPNAQGEDVVSGRRTALGPEELERRAPDAYRALTAARALLEQEFGDMQDFEFTVEQGRLLMLQTRSGKRTPLAALRIACDLVAEQKLTPQLASERLRGVEIEAIETVSLSTAPGERPIAEGTPAGPGVAIGAVVFSADRMALIAGRGIGTILVRPSADTNDVAALAGAEALVTVEGARTSHAAVVARQLGKVCVVACRELRIDASLRFATAGAVRLDEGAVVAVDGQTGRVFLGPHEVTRSRPEALLATARSWQGTPARPNRPRKPSGRGTTLA
ncbi:MAG: PEP/pyruvate-binding domain-containing protein [Hyphomicrobiaceae bacterium]